MYIFWFVCLIAVKQQNDSEDYNDLSLTLLEFSIDIGLETSLSISNLVFKIHLIGLSCMSAKHRQILCKTEGRNK